MARRIGGMLGILLVLVGVVVLLTLLHSKVKQNLEGFQEKEEVEPEERMSPQVFSYNLLQSVKGPIKRLSSQLLDVGVWKERMELARLTPVELARRALKGGA